MNKKLFSLLIALMSLSLLGIIFVQGYWISNSYKTKDEQFSSNVKNSLLNVAAQIQSRELDDYFYIYRDMVDSIGNPEQVTVNELMYATGEDGNDDAAGQGTRTGDTLYIVLDVEEEHWGKWCEFDVTGAAISLFAEVLSGSEFAEPRVPYTVDVLLKLDVSEPIVIDFEQRLDGYTDLDPAIPSTDYDSNNDGNLIYMRPVYDESQIPIWGQDVYVQSESSFPISVIILSLFVILILTFSIFVIINKNKNSRGIVMMVEDAE